MVYTVINFYEIGDFFIPKEINKKIVIRVDNSCYIYKQNVLEGLYSLVSHKQKFEHVLTVKKQN